MQHNITVGTEIVFLYHYMLMRGTCIKVNKTTYKVLVPESVGYRRIEKNVKHERVANILDKFTMVWEHRRGVSGAYRIDYEKYPEHNAIHTKWYQAYTYITED